MHALFCRVSLLKLIGYVTTYPDIIGMMASFWDKICKLPLIDFGKSSLKSVGSFHGVTQSLRIWEGKKKKKKEYLTLS